MKEEDEVRAVYEKLLDEYDKSAEGGASPNGTLSSLRELLEWVLGEGEGEFDPGDHWVRSQTARQPDSRRRAAETRHPETNRGDNEHGHNVEPKND